MHETTADRRLWTRRSGLLLLGLLVWRVVYVALVPLDLCPDEAYYWDWSRQLDWGYYSKPPMVAWLIALSTWLGGQTEFAIRLPAALLSTLGLVAVVGLGRSLFSARVGFWSMLAVVATPGTAAMSLLMTIDAPFLCAWAFSVWAAWELLSAQQPSWRQVGFAVIATGLGLLSKQTMLAIFPLTALWLVMQADQRGKLLSPKVWAWWCGSLLFLTPVILWNAQHDWITVQHTTEHFQKNDVPPIKHLIWLLEFWASQFGVASPVSCGLILGIAASAMMSLRDADQKVRYLICLGFVPLLGVTVLSATQRVQPNWPAPFWLTCFVLLAAWGCETIPRFGLRGHRVRWFKSGVALGAVMMLGIYVMPFTIPHSNWAGGPLDATARLRGWADLGQQVGVEFDKLSDQPAPLCISATGRGQVSELAYYLPQQPRVYRWNPTGIVESQHEVWGGPRGDVTGAEALIVTHAGQPVPAELIAAFAEVTPGSEVAAHLGGKRSERLQLWHARGYRQWPQLGAREAAPPRSANAADSHLR